MSEANMLNGNSKDEKLKQFKDIRSKAARMALKLSQYDSSSDDEVDTEKLKEMFEKYSNIGGDSKDLERTQHYLESILTSGEAICLICICGIKRRDKIWNCKNCFCALHLQCIERWSKDSLYNKNPDAQDQETSDVEKKWSCPKCRFQYQSNDIPKEYICFCTKVKNPPFDPTLIPHSCGQICGKELQSNCGHKCVLLCHPGPCAPCPRTIEISCYCGAQPTRTQRCINKYWTCEIRCQLTLSCGKHICGKPCHRPGECPPCADQSFRKCLCQKDIKLVKCSELQWQCNKQCLKQYSCGIHVCEKVCHEGDCGKCILSLPRTCPCGKSKFAFPCTEETLTCGDTCEKLLACGIHKCNRKCHKNDCGTCMELVTKTCRCGQHSKEIVCHKEFICESKCKKWRDCQKHLCSKKCCKGDCPPCNTLCNQRLLCNKHKCKSICHRGPCFPCSETFTLHCFCKRTSLTVPCGHKKGRLRCMYPCSRVSRCHHKKDHKCHDFSNCPPCKQVCGLQLKDCSHTCPAPCHLEVTISNPNTEDYQDFICVKEPCPPCVMPVPVVCSGGHEDQIVPCYQAQRKSCGKPCGQMLNCGMHTCQLQCHPIKNEANPNMGGTSCGKCNNFCSLPRPKYCSHSCGLMCHKESCPPCQVNTKITCHCGLSKIWLKCYQLDENYEDKENVLCCGIQCHKKYPCGHSCEVKCHSGPCPKALLCEQKTKVYCPCNRIKKDVSCKTLRETSFKISCDDICKQIIEKQEMKKRVFLLKKQQEEEERIAKEYEEFNKRFQKKKRNRKKVVDELDEESNNEQYFYYVPFIVLVMSILLIIFYFS